MPSHNTYIITTRNKVSRDEYGSDVGPTAYLKIPKGQDSYGPQNAVDKEKWRRQVIAAADGVEDEITGSTGNILVFVHGYNNSPEIVLWRTRMLQETLNKQGWLGVVIAFDWPSANNSLNYLGDRWDASTVSTRMVDELLQMLIIGQFPTSTETESCKINVHLLGHSTGAYVIMEAFAQAQKKGDFYKKNWRIGQVAFIAGDVSRSSLQAGDQWGAPMFSRISRLTNYSNGFDKVLASSNAKRLGTSPRAGRVGLPDDGHQASVNVDCSDLFATLDPDSSTFRGSFCHSWHIGNPDFALDLAMTLEGDIDRNKFPTRQIVGSNQLRLVPGRERPKYQKSWTKEG